MSEVTIDRNTRVCPACGQQAAFSRGKKNNFKLFLCRDCSTLYAIENPSAGRQENYDSYYTAENLEVPTFIDRRLDEIISTFEPYRNNNRLLDVGFGAGSFLQAATRDNWQAFGVEVSQTAVDHVSERGFELFCGELQEARYPDNYFDVVVASEVLEHVPYPHALLKEMTRVLRPEGMLWATTPHGRGISARLLGLGWSAICPPEHLQLFSVNSIRELLSCEGFRQIELATHGTNPYEIVNEFFRRATGRTQQDSALGDGSHFNRVESSYELNESLSGNTAGRMVKTIVNGLLNIARLGDSIKIRAEK